MEGVGSLQRSALRWNIALRLHTVLHRALRSAIEHDCLNVAQATAYSAMVSLFPALIVFAAVISLLPESAPIREQIYALFDRILPPQVSQLMESYFDATAGPSHTVGALTGAITVSLLGGISVITTLMDGFSRAQGYAAGRHVWSFWSQRRRALAMVPLLLVPLVAASFLLVFGDLLAARLAGYAPTRIAPTLYVFGLVLRWAVAIAGCVGLMATLYRNGTPRRQAWGAVLPGALTATLLWLVSTLGFGWYARNFANYSRIYGTLGVGIALMVWLYILFLSVLSGAEFNAHFFEVCVWEPAGRSRPVS